MKDAELTARYRELMARRSAGDRSECIPPEGLLELAERTGPDAERVRLLNHVMACEACRQEYELLLALVDQRPRKGRFALRPLAVAATIILILGAGALWLTMWDAADPDALRGPESAVTLVAPEPDQLLAGTPTFVWHEVDGALEYELELLDRAGNLLFASTTRDTVLRLPASASLDAGGLYSWWVRARLPDGEFLRSELRPLRTR